MKIVNKCEFQHRQLKSQKSGELYSFSHVISDLFGARQVFLTHDIIAPQKRASSAHRHSYIEEIVFILKGQASVMWGEERKIAEEGSFIFFDPKEVELHYLFNETDCEIETITFSVQRKDDVVIYEKDKI